MILNVGRSAIRIGQEWTWALQVLQEEWIFGNILYVEFAASPAEVICCKNIPLVIEY